MPFLGLDESLKDVWGDYWQERKQQKQHVDSEAKLSSQLDDLRHDVEMMRYFLFYSFLSVSCIVFIVN